VSKRNAIYGVGIIGCGLIGRKRASSLGIRGRLVACADLDSSLAKGLAQNHGAFYTDDFQEVLGRSDVDLVIISTPHNSLVPIALEAIKQKKHLLIEKPAARSAVELNALISAAEQSQSKIRVGFNHRYHRAFRRAKQIIDSGELGDLMFLRARYGHGGRIGYESEWRAEPSLSGGGELIDQGSHLIDLSQWILGRFTSSMGHAKTYYWNMPVDDNAFMILKTDKEKTAMLHVSCTEWKNTFSMEIYGKGGKLEISGLGGSYGMEKLTHYKMLPEMGPPETLSWEYPMADDSWGVEMSEFYDDIDMDRAPCAGLNDAHHVLGIVGKIYKDSGYDYFT
jgi:predicted dehydrogenase